MWVERERWRAPCEMPIRPAVIRSSLPFLNESVLCHDEELQPTLRVLRHDRVSQETPAVRVLVGPVTPRCLLPTMIERSQPTTLIAETADEEFEAPVGALTDGWSSNTTYS